MEITKDLANDVFDKTIHIRCFYGPVHAGASLSPVRNPLTQEFHSCVRQVDNVNNIIYGKDDDPQNYYVKPTDKIFIKDGVVFDLSNEIQRKQWDAIKYSDLIWDCRGIVDERGEVVYPPTDTPSSAAIFYVERLVDEASKRIKKEKDINTALTYIFGDSASKLALRAMVLGRYIKNSTREEIEEYMIDRAKSDPKTIIDLYTGSDLKLHLLFLYAKEKNIIVNRDGVYFYGDSSMIGRNKDSCVAFFKNPKNKIITEEIEKEVLRATVDFEKDTKTMTSEDEDKTK